MAKRKYLFFDIDGTISVGIPGRQYIPDSTKAALEQLRKAGHFLSIATGRAEAMARDHMHSLGFHNMVSDGGYGLTINGEFKGVRPLDRDKCLALIDECKEKGYYWGIQVDNSTTRLVPDEHFMECTHDVYMNTRVVGGLDPRDYPDIFKVYVVCYEPEEEKLDTLKELPWARYHAEYLYVEPADKAYGIKKMVDAQGGNYRDVVVFGDGKNDMSMFIPEWTSVAMGNAYGPLKERATFVTDEAAQDGIWNACERLGLFEPVDE